MDWVLRQARISDDAPLQDIGLEAGKITAIAPSLATQAAQEWDLAGQVVLPGMVDLHTHLDKTYATTYNKSGTLLEAIEVWTEAKRQRTPEQAQTAVRRALQNAISYGVTGMRSHVNTIETEDLPIVEAIMDVCRQMQSQISVELVALGDAAASAEADDVLECSLNMGVDYVGGAPSLSSDPQASIDTIFAIAEKTGKPIDLHIDETEDPNMLMLEYLADKTITMGMQGQVTAGHCCSLTFVDDETAARVMDKVAQAEMTMVTLPSCNLVLMGREMSPPPRGVTRIKELLAHGVNVCAASDNVRDPFNPFGAYDQLQIANLTAHVAHMTGEAELYASLAMVSSNPARAFGSDLPTIVAVGQVADLVVVEAASVLETVLYPPARLGTFKAGRLVVKTTIEQEWHDI